MGILVIEDDEITADICKKALQGFAKVWVAHSLEAAKSVLSREPVELMICDIALPDGNGMEFYNSLSYADGKTPPVIFLTTQSQTHSKVVAFSMGAVDYISKPFDALELQARVRAHWQRLNSTIKVVEWGIYRLDLNAMKAQLQNPDGIVDLDCTIVEFRLLLSLIQTPEKIFTRDELIDRVWGPGHFISERNVDSHVARLRKKLTPHGGNIQAVRGCGYRISSLKSEKKVG